MYSQPFIFQSRLTYACRASSAVKLASGFDAAMISVANMSLINASSETSITNDSIQRRGGHVTRPGIDGGEEAGGGRRSTRSEGPVKSTWDRQSATVKGCVTTRLAVGVIYSNAADSATLSTNRSTANNALTCPGAAPGPGPPGLTAAIISRRLSDGRRRYNEGPYRRALQSCK